MTTRRHVSLPLTCLLAPNSLPVHYQPKYIPFCKRLENEQLPPEVREDTIRPFVKLACQLQSQQERNPHGRLPTNESRK